MADKHTPPWSEMQKELDKAWDRALRSPEPTDDQLNTMHLDTDAHLAPIPPAKPRRKPGLKAWAGSKKKT